MAITIPGYQVPDSDSHTNYNAVGRRTNLKGWPLALEWTGTFAAPDTADATLYLCLCHIPTKCTVTGVKFEVVTQGDTTGDAEQKVGLYSIDPAGNTITLVASSANDADLYDVAAGVVTTPFSATYEANPGLYYTAALVNWSAQTTEPQLRNAALPSAAYAGIGVADAIDLGGTIGSQATMPASDSLSDVVATANIPLLFPY